MKQYEETYLFQLTGCVLASCQHYACDFKCWGVPGLVVAVNITVLKVVMNSDCGLRVVSMGGLWWWWWGADSSIPPTLSLPHTQIQTPGSQPKDRHGEKSAHLAGAYRRNLLTSPTHTPPVKSRVTLNTLLAWLTHPFCV